MTARRHRSLWLVLVPAAVLLVGAWQRRWMTDDAFIHLRVVEQLLDGHGPVFNPGERVEASTSPLWVLLLAILSAPPRIRPEVVAVTLGLLSTIAGLLLAAWGAARLWREAGGRPVWLLPVGAVVLAVLPPMWDFATSGLETGLGFWWLGACFALLARLTSPTVRWRVLRGAAVVAGLGPLVRPDFAVFTAAFLVPVMARAASVADRRRPRLTLLGAALAIPVAYQVFRMGYYAALVPNTAFAKEASRAWWSQGFRYFGDFVGTYWLGVPVLAVLVLIASGARKWGPDGRLVFLAAPVFGAVVHGLYVTRVGGDFMHARLLLPTLFALVMPVTVVPVRGGIRWAAVAVVLPWAVVCGAHFRVDYVMTPEGLTNERRFYAEGTRRSNPVLIADFVEQPFHEDGVEARRLYRSGQRLLGWRPDPRNYGFASTPLRTDIPVPTAFTSDYVGVLGFVAGPDVYIIDRLGLGDSVAARLAVTSRGRPGHEKGLGMAWVLARVADPQAPLPDGVSQAAVDAARAAMACGPLRDLHAATTGRLTPARFLDNIGRAIRLRNFRVDPNPVIAQEQLCRQ